MAVTILNQIEKIEAKLGLINTLIRIDLIGFSYKDIRDLSSKLYDLKRQHMIQEHIRWMEELDLKYKK